MSWYGQDTIHYSLLDIYLFLASVFTPIRQHLENRLQSAGLKPNDLPRAILIHELLGLLFLAFTWTSCYYLPPSQIPGISDIVLLLI